MTIKVTAHHEKFIDAASKLFPGQSEFSVSQIKRIVSESGCPRPGWLIKPKYRVGHGTYSLELAGIQAANVVQLPTSKVEPVVGVNLLEDDISVVPEKVSNYIPFGHFSDLKSIVQSRLFFPVFVTGLSGNGKTMMVEQICARLKRECYRVNITIETDEDDLIGSNTLVDGNIVYREGPVLKAMRKGAVLLIDEIDLASNKIMCLQSILEGKGYLIKKTGEYVTPTPGFTIIATANTKGKGSDDGRFIGTNVLNEAFLERFSVTMEQEYPSNSVEKKILIGELKGLGLEGEDEKDFADKLITWADVIRKSFYEGAIDELISTRRLVHIVQAYKMFGQRLKAIQMCVSRFDSETKATFLDLYTKVDADEIETESDNDESTAKSSTSDYSEPDNGDESF